MMKKCDFETSDAAFAKSRIVLRNYFRELSENSKGLFSKDL